MNPSQTVRRYEVSVSVNVSVVVTVEGPEDIEELRDRDYNMTDAIVMKQLMKDIENGEASFDLTVDDAWPTQEVTQ